MMTPRRSARFLVVAAALAAACERAPTLFIIEGTVVSAETQQPIHAAWVALQIRPESVFDVGVRVASTDPLGRYRLETTVPCVGLRLTASASGYWAVGSDGVRCTGDVQVFDFALPPVAGAQ